MRIRFERRDDHSQCSDFWPWHTWPFFTVVPEQLLSFIPGVPLCSFDDPPLLWLKCWEFGIHSSPPFRGRCCQNYCGYLVWVFQARGWWSKKNTACFKESVRLGPGCVFFENQNPGSQVHGYADVATDGASKAASWFFHPDPELCSVLLVSKGIVRMLYHTVFPLKNASFSVTHTHINSMQIYFMYNTHMYFWCQIKVSGVPGSFRDFSELHIFSTEVFSIERWSSKYFQWSSHKIDKNWYSIHYTRLFDLICDEIQVIENGRGISSEDFEKAVENSYDFNFLCTRKTCKIRSLPAMQLPRYVNMQIWVPCRPMKTPKFHLKQKLCPSREIFKKCWDLFFQLFWNSFTCPFFFGWIHDLVSLTDQIFSIFSSVGLFLQHDGTSIFLLFEILNGNRFPNSQSSSPCLCNEGIDIFFKKIWLGKIAQQKGERIKKLRQADQKKENTGNFLSFLFSLLWQVRSLSFFMREKQICFFASDVPTPVAAILPSTWKGFLLSAW